MKKVSLVLATAAILALFASCGSTPEVEETAPEAPVLEEVSDESLNSDEQTADDSADVEDSDSREALLAKIEEARKAALEAGADKKAPEVLAALDALYDELKNSDGDISQSGKDLAARYSALASYIQAKEEKQKIDENGFASYAQSDYDAGVSYLTKVEEAIQSENWSASVRDDAKKAYGKFKNVTFAAYKKLAVLEREKAYEAKRNADSVKAGVSRKEQYKEAAELFKSGDQLYAVQNPEKAYNNYKSAKEQFTVLYEDVSKKRAEAQAKLEEAKRAVEDSANFAEKADRETPILDSEEIEGIEEAGAVLLEEDSYKAPEEAEIEIPAAIDENGNAVDLPPVYYEESLEDESVEEAEVVESEPEVEDLVLEEETSEDEDAAEAETAESESFDSEETSDFEDEALEQEE